MGYDHRKLPEHEQALKALHDARRSYDVARTKGSVSSAQQRFRSTLPKLDQLFDQIDHWGVSSQVLPDYKQLVETFSDAYPNARMLALAGDKTTFESLGREVDARFAAIDAWLREARESEHE